MKSRSRQLYEFVIDAVYPNRCPACDKVIGRDICFCSKCEEGLEYLEDLPWQSFFPSEVAGEAVSFDCGVGLFKYEGLAAESVKAFKYKSALGFGSYAAKRLALKLDSELPSRPDLVTSVPMYFINRFNRGYDQAQLLAKAVAEELELPCNFRLLGHKLRRRSQHTLTALERGKAARETYFIRKDAASIKDKRILLCDDVFTTGSTADSCARLLKELGAKAVYVAAICVTGK